MGNAGSAQLRRTGEEREPARSLHSLITEQISTQRLRLTENGAIIHNGGTISIRSLQKGNRREVNESGSNVVKGFYGSAPDLRTSVPERNQLFSHSKLKISKSRKKYKAPPAPQNTQGDSSSPDSYDEWQKNRLSGSQPSRRLRLFRTRAETKKNISELSVPSLPYRPLKRSLSASQLEVDVSDNIINLERNIPNEDSYKRANNTASSEINYSNSSNDQEISYYKKTFNGSQERVHQHITHEHNDSWQRISPIVKTKPVKTFYFGMTADEQLNDSALVEQFAEKLHHISHVKSSNTHTSTTSSTDSLTDYNPVKCQEVPEGICVQLRATLPRKQLDIPRFSPTVAWRLLSAFQSPVGSEEDDLLPMEERIPSPHLPSQIDKSADSGISGDASPHHHDSTHNSQAAWTPQQDLEDTSSDGGLDTINVSPESLATAKFSPRFSLSLPRDNRMRLYSEMEKDEYQQPVSLQSLKKLRRSMSGALGKGTNCKEQINHVNEAKQLLDSNWVLSRSVPNSLNITNMNIPKNIEVNTTEYDEEENKPNLSPTQEPSFLYLANGGHIMYLPSYTTPRERSVGSLAMSKSCEDLSCEISEAVSEKVQRMTETKSSNHKFTYQSTIRQTERKILAEKLSKEAEYRERERHSEIEAMQRVEEEFQKKREREKADIRQQLWLYNSKPNENNKFDLMDVSPPVTQILSEFRQSHREYREYRPQKSVSADQDTAIISDPSRKRETVHPEVVYKIPKKTQVYINPRQNSTRQAGTNNDIGALRSTNTSDNYRKDFAQGALPYSLASSDSDVSLPNTRLLQNRTSVTSQLDIPVNVADIKQNEMDVESTITIYPEHTSLQLKQTPIIRSATSLEKIEGSATVTSNLITPVGLSCIQPFVREKIYRSVSHTLSSNPIAQIAT